MGEVRICEPGGHGTFLPLFEWESDVAHWLRSIVYLALSLYCFVGIAILADVFMVSIEKITSQETEHEVSVYGRTRTIRSQVWNPTVANLTLMALGSSAPEILLACIELISRRFYSGELGSATIVGSAAFNLLVITAVCIVAIPKSQTRKVSDPAVLFVTGFFSVFAYLWVGLILGVISPDQIEIWEGAVTLALCPVLVLVAYAVDVGMISRVHASYAKLIGSTDVETGRHINKEHLQRVRDDLVVQFGDVSDETVEQVALRTARSAKRRHSSRAYYRISTHQAISSKGNTGFVSRKVHHISRNLSGSSGRLRSTISTSMRRRTLVLQPISEAGSIGVSFASPKVAVLESVGTVRMSVKLDRSALADNVGPVSVVVTYRTVDGTAKAGQDFVGISSGTLVFKQAEDSKWIEVEIIDDDVAEDDESFKVQIIDAHAVGQDAARSPNCTIGPYSTTSITIIDDDMPGVISAARDHVKAKLGQPSATVILDRHQGLSGPLTVSYECADLSARAGEDYTAVSGKLTFAHGQSQAEISVPLLKPKDHDEPRSFVVRVYDPGLKVEFEDVHTPSDPEEATVEAASEAVTTVTVDGDSHRRQRRLMNMLTLQRYRDAFATASWREQFLDAWTAPRSSEDASGRRPPRGLLGWLSSPAFWLGAVHYVSLPWKLLAATIPPTAILNGKLCFGVSLGVIGLVTALVGDLAGLLGCCIGLPDLVVGITLVALGTSLPDTFASRKAAVEDEDADASIGNITGSNSVNVYLGLGLPWLLGSLYWRFVGPNAEWLERYPTFALEHPTGAFYVPAGDLAYSVTMYTAISFSAFALLATRRWLFDAELGGPRRPAVASAAFLALLWATFVWLVSTKSSSS